MGITSLAVVIVWLFVTSVELKKVIFRGYSPGKCDEKTHGNLTTVQDRQGNDKLLICFKENDLYVWRATDGSNSVGEFFNSAYDCSDILDQNTEAKNGFYWIKFNGPASSPKKVWCDMTTDGGGFMLIGRKKSPVMWTVPSNNNPVKPFGKPQWTSSLGDAPILDFRIQVATQDDFSATQAHWSLRLKNKRPLKKLLMVSKGGCGNTWSGIGDIAYVKDLLTEKIVTTTFRCSHFGFNHHESLKFGWAMMNSCLEHPCPLGFAYHHKFPIQTDYSGAFSFTASGTTSGVSNNSTSFVGCHDKKCCACFGPVGGTKNYCSTECKGRNGGTVVKNVYAWFWVRSSLPKRVWKKCMEYKVSNTQGKVAWYKLFNGNAIPKMGRCNQNEALLNDGIVVVPDSAAAQNIPPVPGLLEYRKDNKKLYVRSNETWNVIAEEKKMTNILNTKLWQITNSLADLKSQLGIVKKTVDDIVEKVKFQAKFTNLGTTGRFGPTSLGSHYVGKYHEDMVKVVNGIQLWTVPYTGVYEITAVGAAGGYSTMFSSSSARGRGAYMKGRFSMNKGDVVKILVGQQGAVNSVSRSLGGGGGSFVATSSNTPLIVAGGGGGTETLRSRLARCDASTGTSGKQNQCKSSCAIWPGGVNGYGALTADRDNSGGGGGGFYGNGRSSKQFGGAYGNGGEGGRGFIQGGAGGRAWYNNAVGGFGGGGGAYGQGGGAGGGGGYSGGASGNNNYDSCGGGGGSYNSGKNQVKKEGYNGSGHGYVEIRFVS